MTGAGLVLAIALALSDSPPPSAVFAVYEGTLACDGCRGIETQLTFHSTSPERLEGAHYWLKETYRGGPRDGQLFESGGGLYESRGTPGDPAAVVYELREARSRTSRFFRATPDGGLRPLDAGRRDTQDAATLKKKTPPVPKEP